MSPQTTPSKGMQQIQAHMKAGRHAEAIALLQRACESAPDNARLHFLLGSTHATLRQWHEAIEALQHSIRIRPDIAQPHCIMAKAQLASGQRDEAVKSYMAALELDATLVDVHIALANILVLQEDFITARSHLEKALANDPASSSARLVMGLLEQAEGNDRQALPWLEQALEQLPRSPRALCAMGLAQIALLNFQAAGDYFQKAVDINPDYTEAVTNLALVHERMGDYDKASELIEPLIKKGRRHVALGVAFARTCRHTNRCKEAIDYINDILKLPQLPRLSDKNLHFAAGTVLDRMKDYDAAFAHFKAGNETITHLYDAVANAQYISDLISTFTPGLFMRLPRASRTDRRPVFIVGMPRSGTSLTEQILAAHPGVHAAGELTTLSRITLHMPGELGSQRHYPFCLDKLGQDDADRLSDQYLQQLTAHSPDAARITDKMPHNFYFLGLIQLLFPDARIIHCHREPLDTCVSIYFQDFLTEHEYARDLFNIGIHYHQYLRLMAHWQQVLSLPILDVCYEELVSNQEAVSRRMLAFCDLEWDANCLQFHKVQRSVMTASYDQVRQPMYAKSVARWRHYEQYLDDLKEGLRRGY